MKEFLVQSIMFIILERHVTNLHNQSRHCHLRSRHLHHTYNQNSGNQNVNTGKWLSK